MPRVREKSAGRKPKCISVYCSGIIYAGTSVPERILRHVVFSRCQKASSSQLDRTGCGGDPARGHDPGKCIFDDAGGYAGAIHRVCVQWSDFQRCRLVYAKMLAMAQADGIMLGKPFLRCIIRDMKTKSIIRETRCERKFGKLSAKLRYVDHQRRGDWYGEKGHIELAVEYEYRI